MDTVERTEDQHAVPSLEAYSITRSGSTSASRNRLIDSYRAYGISDAAFVLVRPDDYGTSPLGNRSHLRYTGAYASENVSVSNLSDQEAR